MFTYKIAKKNTVEIFESEAEGVLPTIIQPQWPNGTPWQNQAEAETWAQVYVEAANNPDAPTLPGFSPEEPTRPRPADEADEAEEAPAE